MRIRIVTTYLKAWSLQALKIHTRAFGVSKREERPIFSSAVLHLTEIQFRSIFEFYFLRNPITKPNNFYGTFQIYFLSRNKISLFMISCIFERFN